MVKQTFGRFEVIGFIGNGAFASVLLAYDAALDAPVALKVLADNHSFDPELRERFVGEARVLRRLAADPRAAQRLVAVHDIAEEDGRPYLVLEYFPRGSLGARLNGSCDPVDAPMLRRLADELTACLQVIHQHGVTHRDVTPSNLLIRGGSADVQTLVARGADPSNAGAVGALGELSGSSQSQSELFGADETLVLADFGLARASHQTNLTVGSGTPGYSAPEQMRATTQVTPRADLYAATAVLVAAASGSPVLSDAARGRLRRGDLAVIDRCLAEDPAQRPADAAAWREAVEPVLEGLAAVARDGQVSGSEGAEGSSQSQSRRSRAVTVRSSGSSGRRWSPANGAHTGSPGRPGRRRLLVVSAAVAAVVLAGVGATAAWLGGPNGGPRSGVSPAPVATDAGPAPTGGADLDGEVGPLATDGAAIVDSAGQPVQLSGVNWLGLDGPECVLLGLEGVSLDNFLTQVRSKGFTMIRLLYTNACLSTRSSGVDASVNPRLVGRTGEETIDEVVRSAGRHSLRVLLARQGADASDQGGLWYSKKLDEAGWIKDWVRLAQRFRGVPTVIGADLHDEPRGTACWGCGDKRYDWAGAATRAGDAILAVNPDWLIVVQGVETNAEGVSTWWGSDLSAADVVPVRLKVPGRLVYAAHDFPSTVFEQPWFRDSRYPANLPEVWRRNWGFLVESGKAPVMIGGFGTLDKTTKDQQWVRSLVAYLDKHEISFAYSSLTLARPIGGLYDPTTRMWEKPTLDVLRPILNPP
ncbi:MAG: cellulase family glycosylhydrolase [Dermatophilaceae bacterium]